MRYLMAMLWMWGVAVLAQGELQAFLAPLQSHPAVVASRALVEAAEARYRAVYTPVGFTLQGAYTRLSFDDEVILPPGLELPENLINIELGLNVRPFPFGDIADLAAQRRIELERARLSYRQTLSRLEVQALELALQLRLAEAGREVATAALALSEAALAATRLRFERGAAGAGELAEAEARLAEAQQGVREAEDNLALARLSLSQLVGEARLTELPELVPVSGTLPEVLQAEYDLALAEVGRANSARALYPVAQLSYTVPLDARSELALAIESRTLQPSLRYSYSNPRQSFGGFSPPPGVDPSALRSTLTVGVALEISGERLAAADAALAQLAAAQAGLAAARDSAELTARSLAAALESSALGRGVAERNLELAEQRLAETRQRRELGLASELELLQAELSLRQAELSARRSELERVSSILATYSSYALPLSEVLP